MLHLSYQEVMRILTAFSLIASASASVVSLTTSNFDELTAGKTVFIKYFAPWSVTIRSRSRQIYFHHNIS